MKKIKLFVATALVVSLLGVSSYAAVTTTPKGIQKVGSSEVIDALNNNADVLESHVDKIAGTDILGHIKIGTGLNVTEDGVANVKIANDLKTDDAETALSAAMGVALSESLNEVSNNSIKVYNASVDTDVLSPNDFDTLHTIKLTDLPVAYSDILAIIPYGFMPSENYDTILYFRYVSLGDAPELNLYVKGTRSQYYNIQYCVLYK